MSLRGHKQSAPAVSPLVPGRTTGAYEDDTELYVYPWTTSYPVPMKYADGPTAEATVFVAAPPEVVWAYVSDIHFVASLSREVQTVEWVDGEIAPPAVGCTFLGHNAHPQAGEWTTPNRVVACEAPREFVWNTGYPDSPATSWHFELTPRDAGTEVRQWVRMGPGWSNLVPLIEATPEKEERIVARRLADFQSGIDANLAAIKEIAEQDAGTAS